MLKNSFGISFSGQIVMSKLDLDTNDSFDYEEEDIDSGVEDLTIRLTEDHALFSKLGNEWDVTWGEEILVTLNRPYNESLDGEDSETTSWSVFNVIDSFNEDRTNELDSGLELDIIERCNKKYK